MDISYVRETEKIGLPKMEINLSPSKTWKDSSIRIVFACAVVLKEPLKEICENASHGISIDKLLSSSPGYFQLDELIISDLRNQLNDLNVI